MKAVDKTRHSRRDLPLIICLELCAQSIILKVLIVLRVLIVLIIYIYVYIYVCVYVYIYVYICVYIYVWVYMYETLFFPQFSFALIQNHTSHNYSDMSLKEPPSLPYSGQDSGCVSCSSSCPSSGCVSKFSFCNWSISACSTLRSSDLSIVS